MNDSPTIILSRRNLLALLHKLEMPGSARTIVKYDEDNKPVVVKVASDEEVYADRQPGRMHEDTEKFIEFMETEVKRWKSGQTWR